MQIHQIWIASNIQSMHQMHQMNASKAFDASNMHQMHQMQNMVNRSSVDFRNKNQKPIYECDETDFV